MFTSASMGYYIEHPGNSRELETEERDIKSVIKTMKRHGVQVMTQQITRTAVNIEIPTSINATGEVSSELLTDIATIKGELNNGYIYIKRPSLWSYGQLGFFYLNIGWWIVWLWWNVKDYLAYY